MLFALALIPIVCGSLRHVNSDFSKLKLGVWYDRERGDAPTSINSRLGLENKTLTFWQSNIFATNTIESLKLNQFILDVEQTNTDAFIYLTVYPWDGFDKFDDDALHLLARKVRDITATGREILLRYAPEANGSWFAYGQQPTAFVESWKRVYRAIKHPGVYFLWAPNSGTGYPFPNNIYSVSTIFDPVLDTNRDNLFDMKDDPYSPYYPGDEFVDWVGLSIYHYGANWHLHDRWDTNDIPALGKVESILHGNPDPVDKSLYSGFDFYEMFSGKGCQVSNGGKPFIIAETAAVVHTAIYNNQTRIFEEPKNLTPEFRKEIKQAWWRQIFNMTFLETHPMVKAVCLFEFIKTEEFSDRDFTSLGLGAVTVYSTDRKYGNETFEPTLNAFRGDLSTMADIFEWSNEFKPSFNYLKLRMDGKSRALFNSGFYYSWAVGGFLTGLIFVRFAKFTMWNAIFTIKAVSAAIIAAFLIIYQVLLVLELHSERMQDLIKIVIH